MDSANNSIGSQRILKLFKQFSHYIRPDIFRNLLNIIVICSVTLTGAVLIWMVGQGFDALGKTNFSEVPYYLAGFLALVVLLQSLRYLNYYLLEWMQQGVIHSIRRKMYGHLFKLGFAFRDKFAKGDLLTRLSQDIVLISELLVLMPAHIFMYGFTLVLYLGILFYIDTWLALITVILAPLIFLHQRIFIGKTRKAAHAFLSNQGKMGAFEEESLRNLQGIITFSASSLMVKRFDKLFKVFRQSAMKNLLLNNAFIVSFELLIAVAAIFLVAVGVYRIEYAALTAGGLINFLLYLGYMSVPLRALANLPIESQIRAVATERVAEILQKQPEVIEIDNPKKLTDVSGAISFQNVSFSYQADKPVLENIIVHIKAGECVAIMGESGVGKSTLARLLMRFYDPDKGCILIDGRDIQDVALDSLRSNISAVLQDPFLIDDTIYENLKLCKEDASHKEIEQALRDAGAYEFIKQLTDGLNTRLGNSGIELSTGQKQRIAIAQALLKDAPILILDEATSALDSHSETAIQKTIQGLHGKCTVIIIAHRLSTIINSDRVIYVNNDGTITAGTYNELKKNHYNFRKVISHQTNTGTTLNLIQ